MARRPGSGKARRTFLESTGFPALFSAAFARWRAHLLPKQQRRAATHLADLLGITDTKNFRNWMQGISAPASDGAWAAVRGILAQAPANAEHLPALDAAFAHVRGNVEPAAPASQIRNEARHPADTRETEIWNETPFPRLAYVNVDHPPQGNGPEKFVVTGELGFAAMTDPKLNVEYALRRVVMIPEEKACSIVSGSRYGQAEARPEVSVKAKQIVFEADPNDRDAVLTKTYTCGPFLEAQGTGGDAPPELALPVLCERDTDLKVTIRGKRGKLTRSEVTVAQRFLQSCHAQPDGTVRLASAGLRWKRK